MLRTPKSLILFSLGLFVSLTNAWAAISVELYSGTNNLPQVVIGNTLENRTDLDPGYAAIFNESHSEYSGASDYEFARYYPDGGGDCIYWFGANDEPVTYYDSYASVHWLGYGNSTLVDGAKWGSDNYIHFVSDGTTIGILQFSFDENTETAAIVAAATDLSGLTFAEGVAAIQAASVPEPSEYAGLLAAAALMCLVIRRRVSAGNN